MHALRVLLALPTSVDADLVNRAEGVDDIGSLVEVLHILQHLAYEVALLLGHVAVRIDRHEVHAVLSRGKATASQADVLPMKTVRLQTLIDACRVKWNFVRICKEKAPDYAGNTLSACNTAMHYKINVLFLHVCVWKKTLTRTSLQLKNHSRLVLRILFLHLSLKAGVWRGRGGTYGIEDCTQQRRCPRPG
jgi:hypothetical protein